MTVAATLLPKLAEWRPAGEGRPAPGNFSAGGWNVQVTAERVDSVGSVLTRVVAVREAPVPEDGTLLAAQARSAAERVRGLMEPLRLIETDPAGNVALVRSSPPSVVSEIEVDYFEVTFQGRNHLDVQRYRAVKTAPARKAPVPFTLTHETLARLIDDLVRD